MKGKLNKVDGSWIIKYHTYVKSIHGGNMKVNRELPLNPNDELSPGSYYPLESGKEVEFYGQISSHSEFEKVATLIKPENLPTPIFESNIDQSDIEHLEWIYERMKYGNNENFDYMIRFRQIINKLDNIIS